MPTRRDFVGRSSAAALFGLADGTLGSRVAPVQATVHDGFPRTDPGTVEEFVRVAHLDLPAVRRMAEAQPSLARASWDWGYGDWETGLGAAAHTGKRDIAELLLTFGARPTIFSAAMMGQLDVVRAFVSAQPGVQRTLGPHGLTLMAHARAGGADAVAVRQYLDDLGDADRRPPSQALDAASQGRLIGRYAFGEGPRDHFDVDVRQDQLGMQRPGTNRRFLLHTGNFLFFPSGVPSVRIAFAVDGPTGRSTRLTIADPEVLLTARRVD